MATDADAILLACEIGKVDPQSLPPQVELILVTDPLRAYLSIWTPVWGLEPYPYQVRSVYGGILLDSKDNPDPWHYGAVYGIGLTPREYLQLKARLSRGN